ncbi:photosynthetic complex assembly protein PuhC [Pseudahrensia aquimaris]|uniref:Photosynthetic complex assembly protein PuhC n=1 Tax=Pseudahrensia aquimaris TaxID=744461 RepID=A0ABW3FKN7_9HYPH
MAKPTAPPPAEITGIHRAPLYGALGVVLFTLAIVLGSAITDGGRVTKELGQPVAERDLIFRDGEAGTIVVRDAASNEKLATYGKGEGAFIRISMRALTHARRTRSVPLGKPYRLVRNAQNHLSILDPQTGEFIKLIAFGSVATESFGRFLKAPVRTSAHPSAKGA